MVHTIPSIKMCAPSPPNSITECTTNARMLDSEGETIAFAQTERKFTTPNNWFNKPASPSTHIKIAGICSILTSRIETSRLAINMELYNSFLAEAHGDFPTFCAAERSQSYHYEKCRKHSFVPGAISNSCWHDTVKGSDFDLIAHGQVRILPQGWERLLSFTKEVL